ncbi:MAG: tetratricopeptide repeat protein [Candidatus Hodarchaeota archaeon]
MGNENPELDEETKKQVLLNVNLMKARNAYENGDYTESIQLLEEVLEAIPDNSSVWLDLAKSYREQGDLESEMKCYKKVVALKDAGAETWLDMALNYRIIGREPEELFCLIMAADKGVDLMFEESSKAIVVDRYRELTISKVQARNPMSHEYDVPIFDSSMAEDEDQGTCFICFKKVDKVKEKGQLLMCPHCKRVAHFICLGSWLELNQICPVCHGALSFNLEDYELDKVMGIKSSDEPEEESK